MDSRRQTEYNTGIRTEPLGRPISHDPRFNTMPTVYLSLGSNLGRRASHLRAALERLNGRDLHLTAVSSFYETAPVGETQEPVPPYLNCAARVETNLTPIAVLEYTQALERTGGRTPTFRWGPRTIDIDLLLYDTVILKNERLILPHPRLFERAFVLIPLAEIAPDLIFPDGTTIAERLNDPEIRAQTIRFFRKPPDFGKSRG